MSAGPRPLGGFSSSFFPFCLFFPVYGREFHTIKCASGKRCLICERQNISLSLTHPVFLTSRVRGNLIPDASSIVPLPLMLPPRVVARVVFHSLCLRGLPPSRTSPSGNACFKVVDHRIAVFHHSRPIPWLATNFRQLPHAERVNPSVPIFSLAVLHVSSFSFFEAEYTTHRLCLPSFDSFESFLGPGPLFHSQRRIRCRLVPPFFDTLTLHSTSLLL